VLRNLKESESKMTQWFGFGVRRHGDTEFEAFADNAAACSASPT
jgi:hypothetical protein